MGSNVTKELMTEAAKRVEEDVIKERREGRSKVWTLVSPVYIEKR